MRENLMSSTIPTVGPGARFCWVTACCLVRYPGPCPGPSGALQLPTATAAAGPNLSGNTLPAQHHFMGLPRDPCEWASLGCCFCLLCVVLNSLCICGIPVTGVLGYALGMAAGANIGHFKGLEDVEVNGDTRVSSGCRVTSVNAPWPHLTFFAGVHSWAHQSVCESLRCRSVTFPS